MSWKDRADKVPEWKARATPVGGESLLSKVGGFDADKGDDLLKGLSLPYEVIGELLSSAVEDPRRPLDNFTAPSIVQKHFDVQDKSDPNTPFSLSNKMLRAGASYIDALVKEGDPDKAAEVARAAYAQDRGTLGIVEDVLLSGLTAKLAPQVANAPIDAVTKGAAAVARGAGKGAKWIGKKGIRVATGVSEEAQSALMNRPDKILNPKTEVDIAEGIGRGYEVLGAKVKRIEKDVDKVLRSSPYLEEGAKPKPDVLLAIDNARKKIGLTVTDQEKYAKNILDGLSENLKLLKNTVSEKQLRSMIQKLDEAIPYGAQTYGQSDRRLMDVRRSWDRMLKTNEGYKKLMAEEVPIIRTQKKLVDKFNLKRGETGKFGPTETTVTKIGTALKENKAIESQPVLRKLGQHTGRDYLQEIQDAKLAKEFAPGKKSEGSRRTNLFIALGAAMGQKLGGWPGAATGTGIGAVTGSTLDYFGGPVAKGLVTMAQGSKEAVKAPIKLAVEAAKKKNADIFFELLKRGIPVASTLQTSQ